MKKVIYLADLMHNDFGLAKSTTPLGIGTIGSYILHKHGQENGIEVRLFRIFDDLDNAVRDKKPDILALSNYAWNENLTAAAFRYFKKLCPDAVFVTGGGNISVEGWEESYNPNEKDKPLVRFSKEQDMEVFRIMPEVDFLVHGFGEYPFANIVEKLLGVRSNASLKGMKINGCTGFCDGEIITGKPIPTILNLDEYPSPYITGLFSEMLEKYHLPPQVECTRGCPYQCAFCTEAGYSKLAKHSFEYIKEEILYLKDNVPNKLLRITDSNWGIFEQDLEVAEFLHKLIKDTGYPVGIRVFYATRGSTGRVKKIAKLMKNYLPLNLSFQTLTPSVLENIKRINRSEDNIKDLVNYAHSNGLSASTELITGLPGETYHSFMDTCWRVIRLGFDSIYADSLYLLKGSDLYTDEERKKYKIKTMFGLVSKGVSKIGNEYCFETEEYLVESSSMNREDFWKLYKFRIFISMIYIAGYFKELIMHLYNYNIFLIDIYEELVSNAEKYPNFNGSLNEIVKYSKKFKLYSSIRQLRKKIIDLLESGQGLEDFDLVYHVFHILGNMTARKNKSDFVDEFRNAAYKLFHEKNKPDDEFIYITDGLVQITYHIMISPMEETEEIINVESYYDYVKWIEEDYSKKLTEYKCTEIKSFSLAIRNFNEHKYLTEISKGYSERKKYREYFNRTVSSNMRRWFIPNN